MSDSGGPPLPPRTPTSAPFWEALDRGELLLQRCGACGTWVHYPRVRCPSCLSDQLGWERVDPTGTVYAFSVSPRPTAPMFSDEVPQVVAVVELDNGVRLTTTLVVDDPSSVATGTAVRGVFDRVAEGTTLLRFQPVD